MAAGIDAVPPHRSIPSFLFPHHQLRAPLAAIQGALDALPYAGPLNEKQVDLISRSSRRITDAFDMIRDLLDLAAAQRPLEDEAKNDVLLKDALLRAVETARERAESKGVSFSTELPKEELTLLGYAADLDRIRKPGDYRPG